MCNGQKDPLLEANRDGHPPGSKNPSSLYWFLLRNHGPLGQRNGVLSMAHVRLGCVCRHRDEAGWHRSIYGAGLASLAYFLPATPWAAEELKEKGWTMEQIRGRASAAPSFFASADAILPPIKPQP